MTDAFYKALDAARHDPSTVALGSEMAKLAARMLPGSRIAGITLGERGGELTPEDIAHEINQSLDLQDSGVLKAYSSFAEAERAAQVGEARRAETPLGGSVHEHAVREAACARMNLAPECHWIKF